MCGCTVSHKYSLWCLEELYPSTSPGWSKRLSQCYDIGTLYELRCTATKNKCAHANTLMWSIAHIMDLITLKWVIKQNDSVQEEN